MVHITSTPTSHHVGMLELPPPLNATPIVPPAVSSTNTGAVFRNSGLSMNTNVSTSDNSTLGIIMELF